MGIKVFACCSSGSHTLIKLLHPTDGPCSELTECGTTAGQEEVDSVFVTLMRGAHTQSKLVVAVFMKIPATSSSTSCCLNSP